MVLISLSHLVKRIMKKNWEVGSKCCRQLSVFIYAFLETGHEEWMPVGFLNRNNCYNSWLFVCSGLVLFVVLVEVGW